MPHDALDPGPGNTYPHWPRNDDGSPRMLESGRRTLGGFPNAFGEEHAQLDLRAYDADGNEIVPPTLDEG